MIMVSYNYCRDVCTFMLFCQAKQRFSAAENKKAVLEAELAKKGESYAAEISKLALELEKIDKKLGVAA